MRVDVGRLVSLSGGQDREELQKYVSSLLEDEVRNTDPTTVCTLVSSCYITVLHASASRDHDVQVHRAKQIPIHVVMCLSSYFAIEQSLG